MAKNLSTNPETAGLIYGFLGVLAFSLTLPATRINFEVYTFTYNQTGYIYGRSTLLLLDREGNKVRKYNLCKRSHRNQTLAGGSKNVKISPKPILFF